MVALAALIAATCLSAPVSYSAPPDTGAPAIPWIHSGPVSGYLFYYSASGPWKTQPERALITPGSGVPGRYWTKILWHVRGGSSGVTVIGQRLDAAGKFKQKFPATSGGFFPSIVVVPSAGCWRLTVTSGRRSARFALLAVTS